MLGRLRPLFRLMLGGRIGTGQQAFPWISLDDEVGAMRFVLERDDISGPVNFVGPEPATFAQFTAAMSEVLNRPTPFVVPAFALKAVLGQMAEELVLTGPLAVPGVLQEHGYQFRHSSIREALQAAIER
jgi:NAD dependent epimerase/dehydratase family enzyme